MLDEEVTLLGGGPHAHPRAPGLPAEEPALGFAEVDAVGGGDHLADLAEGSQLLRHLVEQRDEALMAFGIGSEVPQVAAGADEERAVRRQAQGPEALLLGIGDEAPGGAVELQEAVGVGDVDHAAAVDLEVPVLRIAAVVVGTEGLYQQLAALAPRGRQRARGDHQQRPGDPCASKADRRAGRSWRRKAHGSVWRLSENAAAGARSRPPGEW